MLVALKYASNTCYTECVSPSRIKGLGINLPNHWVYQKEKRKFGEVRHCLHGNRYGVITVMDLKRPKDVDALIGIAKEATRDDSGRFSDD